MLLIDANGVDPEVLCLQIERGLMKSSVAVRTDIKCTVIDQDALCTLWAPGIPRWQSTQESWPDPTLRSLENDDYVLLNRSAADIFAPAAL